MDNINTTLNAQLEVQRKKIDSDNFDVTVRELVRMVTENELKRAPEYQRQFRWDEGRESKLVESIFLGLPVPTIFVAADKDGTWELVDGLQRVSTLIHYIADPPESITSIDKAEPLVLTDLEKLTEFNGKKFSDLPTALQLSFQKRPLRLTALSDKSDLDVRFDMFERLNTGGIELTPQEIRACIFRGTFNDFLKDLAANQDFDALLKLQQSNESDGTREEIVLKFFAYLEKRSKFDGHVKQFLNDYMKNLPPNYDYDSRRMLFSQTVKGLRDAIGSPILRRTANWTPINLMEAILVGAAELIQSDHSQFSPAIGWMDDERLTKTSSKGTNTRSYLNGRIDRARELLAGAEPKVA